MRNDAYEMTDAQPVAREAMKSASLLQTSLHQTSLHQTSLERALRPRSVAVVGAGRAVGGVGRAVFDALLRGGFEGPVYPVNTHADYVGSVRSYPSVRDIPGPVDLAVVAVPRDDVIDVARACADHGVGALLVVSAGFAETDDRGRELQLELTDLVERHGMRMIGPNCLGLVNTDPAVRLSATFSTQPVPVGNVGLLSQSGAVGIAAIEAAAEAGLGISSFVSVGNKADVSGNDVLGYWEDDDKTTIVMLYLESFGDPLRFAEVARRVAARKPIIAVKSGRSVAGSHAAGSHTGAMATTDSAVDALFHQSGVIRVDTVDDMVDVALILDRQPLPAGNRVAIVGNSGGPGIMAVDACEAVGLELVELTGVTRQRLSMVLPKMVDAGNPLDLLAGARASDYEAALSAVLADDGVDAVIVILTRTLPGGSKAVIQAIDLASRAHPGKTVVMCLLGAGGQDDSSPLPSFRSVERAVLALGRVVRYAGWRYRPEGEVPRYDDVDTTTARSIVERQMKSIAGEPATGEPATGEEWLESQDASALLAAYGVPTVRSVLVESAEDAVEIAESFGVPVVVKSADRSLLHKTDVRAVWTDLRSSDEVRDAFNVCRAAASSGAGPVLVQPMVKGGVETIVGVKHDERFGSIVMFGLGGIATELLADRAFRSVPITDVEARSLVREIRGHPLLFGYRGASPVDVGALENLLLRVAQLAHDIPELIEMDLNPVIVTQCGATVVDAKIRLTRTRRGAV